MSYLTLLKSAPKRTCKCFLRGVEKTLKRMRALSLLHNTSSQPSLPLAPAVSDLLLQLPKHGVGCLVTRDTWHPAGGKYWEVVEVVPQQVRKHDDEDQAAEGYEGWQSW